MKNSVKQLLSLFMAVAVVFAFTSCGDDDTAALPPTVSNPSPVSTNLGGTVSLSFTVNVPGGFASATAAATGGTATISSNLTAGDLSGTITVDFTAGAAAGAGSVVLTVNDNAQQSSTGTAVISINNSTAPSVTAPATATVNFGSDAVATFNVSTPGGFASASATASSGTATVTAEPAAGATTGDVTVTVTGASAGALDITLTVTDAEGQSTEASATVNVENIIMVTANITGDVTWNTGNIYVLTTRIAVESGATLNIEAGVVVKGQAGAGANSTALLVARGGTLNVSGTSTSPVIFTSIADNIQPGQIASPNLTPDVQGLWGGIIILGNAPISADSNPLQIEGIPPSDTNGLYGGNNPTDNSGTIRYLSIRHGGTNIGEGNEINGLTLGGVGSGTTIEFVEIVGNQDDGIEPFGGSVDVTNILVWNSGDDSFDCDQAYSGTIDNFIGILGGNSDHAMELDGPEGADITPDAYTLQNGSLKGKGAGNTSGGEYVDLRSDAKANLDNIYFFNFSESSDFELDNNGVATNYLQMEINLTNLQFNTSHLSSGNLTIDDIIDEKVATDDDGNPTETLLDIFTQRPLPSTVAVVTAPTVGANKAMFASWTWADVNGELADFN